MYKYFAKDKNGEVVKGQLDAPSKEYATSMVNSMGLYLISLEEEKKSLLRLPGKVKEKQISIILRQMSTMINAAIPIPVVLTVLRDDERNPTVKEILTSIHKDVTDGTPLSSAMAAYPKYFSPFVINMVEMGETNGRLDMAFDRIATVIEKEVKSAGRAKSAIRCRTAPIEWQGLRVSQDRRRLYGRGSRLRDYPHLLKLQKECFKVINPYIISGNEKDKAIIFGYVIDVKDRGDSNILLFKKDTTDPSSELIAVAAWAADPGQKNTVDMRKMTGDLKGRFVVCICRVRPKEKDGKNYNNYDLQYIIKSPQKEAA